MVTYISTPQELNSIRNKLTESYELTTDIDMGTFGNWSPINDFKGQFDGKGFVIKNLTINRTALDNGLFGTLDNIATTIKNVGIVDCNINSNNNNRNGAIVGQIINGNVENCYSTGEIKGQYIVGGIVGQLWNGNVINCYSHCRIIGIGRVGGLIGHISSSSPIVKNSYSTGHVATSVSYFGGLVGSNLTSVPVENSYWDIETSGHTISAGGTGKTTSEMKTTSTYVGWSTDIWSLKDGQYPTLKVFGEVIVPVIEDRNVISHMNNINSDIILNKIATQKIVASINNFSADTQKIIKAVKFGTTFVKDIVSGVSREIQVVKVSSETVTFYILPITSNVEVLKQQVKLLDENVTSHIKPIISDVERQVKTLRQSLSFIDVIVGKVITPNLSPRQINAIVHHIENGTLSHYLNSQYNVSVLNDLSMQSKIENSTNVNVLINQTLSEVRE